VGLLPHRDLQGVVRSDDVVGRDRGGAGALRRGARGGGARDWGCGGGFGAGRRLDGRLLRVAAGQGREEEDRK
ncbi:MAG: hypothetical protein ABSA51_03780, partial [Anaerolineaceae bacterium]